MQTCARLAWLLSLTLTSLIVTSCVPDDPDATGSGPPITDNAHETLPWAFVVGAHPTGIRGNTRPCPKSSSSRGPTRVSGLRTTTASPAKLLDPRRRQDDEQADEKKDDRDGSHPVGQGQKAWSVSTIWSVGLTA